jgi:hypothetical protein
MEARLRRIVELCARAARSSTPSAQHSLSNNCSDLTPRTPESRERAMPRGVAAAIIASRHLAPREKTLLEELEQPALLARHSVARRHETPNKSRT